MNVSYKHHLPPLPSSTARVLYSPQSPQKPLLFTTTCTASSPLASPLSPPLTACSSVSSRPPTANRTPSFYSKRPMTPGPIRTSATDLLHHQHQSHSRPGTSDGNAASPAVANPADKPPRPPNAWILYRSEKLRVIGESNAPRRPQAEISKIISTWWKEESPSVRAYYERLSDEKKAEHQLKYPGYRFQPMKKADKERQKAEKQAERERQRAINKAKQQGGAAPAGPSNWSEPPTHSGARANRGYHPYSIPAIQTPSSAVSNSSPFAFSVPDSTLDSPAPQSSMPSVLRPNSSHAVQPTFQWPPPQQQQSTPAPVSSKPATPARESRNVSASRQQQQPIAQWSEDCLAGWPNVETGVQWSGFQFNDIYSQDSQASTALWVNTQGSSPPKSAPTSVAPQTLTINIPVAAPPLTPTSPNTPADGAFATRAPIRGSLVPTADPYEFALDLDSLPLGGDIPLGPIDVAFGDWNFLTAPESSQDASGDLDTTSFWSSLTGSGQLDLPPSQVNFSSLLGALGTDIEGGLANGIVASEGAFDFSSVLNTASYGGDAPTEGRALGLDTGAPSENNHRTPYVPPAGANNTSTRRVGGAWGRPPPSFFAEETPAPASTNHWGQGYAQQQQQQEYPPIQDFAQHRRASSPAMSIPGLGMRRRS